MCSPGLNSEPMTRGLLVLLAALGPLGLAAALATDWRFSVPWLGGPLFGLGAVIAALNFHLSALRVPLLRARGMPANQIRHVSGIPIVGTLIVPALYLLPPNGWLTAGAIAAHAIDTGNLAWFTIAVWRDESFLRKRPR